MLGSTAEWEDHASGVVERDPSTSAEVATSCEPVVPTSRPVRKLERLELFGAGCLYFSGKEVLAGSANPRFGVSVQHKHDHLVHLSSLLGRCHAHVCNVPTVEVTFPAFPGHCEELVMQKRLTENRREQVRRWAVNYSMTRRLDPSSNGRVLGEQSWFVTLACGDQGDSFLARLAVHRLPLNMGEDLVLEADLGPDVPAEPLSSVLVDGASLRPDLLRLVGVDVGADEPGATLLVVEPTLLDPAWQGLGVEELFLADVLAELQDQADVLAIANPVDWHLRGRARSAPAALNVPVFENLGFFRYRAGTWVLADWRKLHEAHNRYRLRFGFESRNPEDWR